MHPANFAFDTGAGPILIGEDFLDADWLRAIHAINEMALENAFNPEGSVVETITLCISLEKFRESVWFSALYVTLWYHFS